jgi:hypothetical protein
MLLYEKRGDLTQALAFEGLSKPAKAITIIPGRAGFGVHIGPRFKLLPRIAELHISGLARDSRCTPQNLRSFDAGNFSSNAPLDAFSEFDNMPGTVYSAIEIPYGAPKIEPIPSSCHTALLWLGN